MKTLLWSGLLCAAMVSGCRTSPPKPPKLPVQVKSVAPRVIVLPPPMFTNVFTWGPVTNQFISFGKPINGNCLYSNVVIVQFSPTLSGSWSNYATGRLSSFTLISTNPAMFCRLTTDWKLSQ